MTTAVQPSRTFLSAPAIVSLEKTFPNPFRNVVATARTCYSSKGIVRDEDVKEGFEPLAQSIYKAGHHTTYQHAHFQFALANVSRQFIWSFLHAHPFYNCLAGETEIPHFHVGSKRPWTIKQLYDAQFDSQRRKYFKMMRIRSVNEEGTLVANRIEKVLFTGMKPVYRVETRLGYEILATADHRFMREDGSWARLHELTAGQRIKVNGIPAYKDAEWLRVQYHENNFSQEEIALKAGVSPHTIRSWIRKHNLQKPAGSWSIGVAPPNKGQTKETYEPLQAVSEWARRTGHKPPSNGRAEANSNWKGSNVKNPRDRAKLWYKVEKCEVCGATEETVKRLERHHKNGDILNNSPENIQILCCFCHKAAESPHRTVMRVFSDEIMSIEPVGEVETYDLVMEAPYHNFVANGFVVHNSEQVSQRYVAVKPGTYAIPPLSGAALARYREAVEGQTRAYERLTDMLMPVVAREYNKLFTKHDTEDKKIRAKLRKRALEAARYVLPVATFAYLYHTVSGITLLRYYRLCEQYDAPAEQREVVGLMVRALLDFDPLYQTVLEEPLPIEETPEHAFFQARPETTTFDSRREFLAEFDSSLAGHVSKLIDWKTGNEAVLAAAVREVLGVPQAALPDADAIALVLDPSRNRLLGESLNLTTHSKLARTTAHPHYTFRKKISHTADSQDQRHRMTPGSRPVLAAHFTGEPDYETPALMLEDEAIEKYYRETMERTWDAVNDLLRLGAPEEYALYLLPNAVSIRFTESSDLMNLHHKHRMRLCYLAQEEIWRASVEEARQVRAVNPLIGAHLLPPCTHRLQARTKPICPEGDRFCGVRVWKLDLDEYRRVF